MTFKLSHKLFIANLGIILTLVLVILGVSYVSSKNLLNDFILSHISKDLKNFSSTLAVFYEKERSWEKLLKDKTLWHSIIHSHLQDPLSFVKPIQVANSQVPHELTSFSSDITNAMKPSQLDIFADRISLIGANKRPIIPAKILGHSYKYQSITVNGEVVGWLILGVPNFNKISMANKYLDQQLNVSFWVAAVGIIISGLFSFGLSRHITSPIKRLNQGAKKLAERNFNVHISVNTNDELSGLAKSFNHISEELSNYEKRQKQWLMDISHELRTPLTILQGEFAAISDGVTRYSPSVMNSLQDEVSNMNRLINDLNDLSVTESLSFQCLKETINLSKLISDNLNRYKGKLLNRQISIHTSLNIEGVLVIGDTNRLSQVFGNLLENSFRYSQSPGRLWIDAKTERGKVFISFNDSGPGVSQEAIKQLFERLYRVENSRNRKTGGAGLGLAICKNIISAHSGSINAANSNKGGLCICITLPIAEQ